MTILFVMRSTVYVRNFESTLRALAARGHRVHVLADPHLDDSNALIGRLCAEHPGITYGEPPPVPFNSWSFLGLEIRRGIDYLRYLGPEFANAPKLRYRAERKAPPFVVQALKQPWFGGTTGRRLLMRLLHWADRAVPVDPGLTAWLAERRPDLVLVTPLVEPGSPQSEWLRAARALGMRTGLCVYSWDNLTNKGLIHDPLDVVTVWNEAMRQEAITLHGIPPSRVVVTGSAAYDHWFVWRPRETREAFCRRVGLAPERPYLLYLCSSRFIAPKEVEFVRRWVREVRAAAPSLRDAGVLVRPHPQHVEQWEDADLDDLGGVAVWPRGGANPMDEDSRAGYFDSIHHSAAVVGVNTSALIESAILNRIVHTVLAPEFKDTQDGTLHFRHLREVNGGVLHVAEDMAGHAAQLAAAVAGAGSAERCRRFVEAFVRPFGLDEAAAPRMVAALEAVAAGGAAVPVRPPWYAGVARPALRRLAARVSATDRGRQEKGYRQERIKEQRDAERQARRDDAVDLRRASEARQAETAREAERQAAADAAAQAAATQAAFARYLEVRDWARPFAAGNGQPPDLSDAERTMLAGLAHLWDATPETIATLRRWCAPVSGVEAAEYDAPDEALVMRLKREAPFLRRQLEPGLFVPEPTLLGGFGVSRRRELINEETLRYLKAFGGLYDGGVLGEYLGSDARRLVWEIGGGWGGFAFRFRSVCPRVTYLITGHPETLLLSAVYLTTVFPEARTRFWSEATAADLWRDWRDVDFVFAPEGALSALRPPQLDLTVDLMTLHRMTEGRVARHVQRAFDLGSRYVYSMVPALAAAAGPPPAWQAIARLYWPHPIPERLDPATLVGDEPPPPTETDYAHLVGWRRVRP